MGWDGKRALAWEAPEKVDNTREGEHSKARIVHGAAFELETEGWNTANLLIATEHYSEHCIYSSLSTHEMGMVERGYILQWRTLSCKNLNGWSEAPIDVFIKGESVAMTNSNKARIFPKSQSLTPLLYVKFLLVSMTGFSEV